MDYAVQPDRQHHQNHKPKKRKTERALVEMNRPGFAEAPTPERMEP
jgi:hypothetical protein